jgi:hypothetical protein
MEKLGILPPSVPIQNRRIVKMKKLITIKNIKRSELETRKIYTRKRKTFTPKNIVVHLT